MIRRPTLPAATDAPPDAGLTRRQFTSCAAAAAAGFLLTACGSRRLHEIPKDRLRAAIQAMEKEYTEKYGKTVTVSDQGPLPGVEFAYALDISRCIGCRRCVYACVEENNQSRDPAGAVDPRAVRWTRTRASTSHDADPYYEPEQVPEEGHFYVPVGVPAVPQRALHEGVPDRRHVDGAGRHRRHRLRLVHRLPLLHGGVPLRRAPLQLGRAAPCRGGTEPEHARARQPAAAEGRRREVHVLHPARARRAATRPASRSVRSARASSATCSIPRARSATSSRTSACCVLKEELNTMPKFFYFYGT